MDETKFTDDAPSVPPHRRPRDRPLTALAHPPSAQQVKAGLQFPVGRIHRFLKSASTAARRPRTHPAFRGVPTSPHGRFSQTRTTESDAWAPPSPISQTVPPPVAASVPPPPSTPPPSLVRRRATRRPHVSGPEKILQHVFQRRCFFPRLVRPTSDSRNPLPMQSTSPPRFSSLPATPPRISRCVIAPVPRPDARSRAPRARLRRSFRLECIPRFKRVDSCAFEFFSLSSRVEDNSSGLLIPPPLPSPNVTGEAHHPPPPSARHPW